MMAISFAAGMAVALAATRLRRRRELTAPGIDEPTHIPAPDAEAWFGPTIHTLAAHLPGLPSVWNPPRKHMTS
ncbi:hypothetical protein [Spongiactinospora sp. 9N601]|uniref:hypothetical protein n=1 Tax=Spongiactinospora sp. 9N601 TaxID=3375149 RepID=UPI0037B5DA0D